MTTLLAFLVAIAILVIVHEYGHYLAARANGVRVLRFSVGFGPVLARRTDRHGTEWAISAFPLGGYVKMLDEREGEVAPAELEQAFNRKSVGRRTLIVAAGPVANFLLAILLYWALFVHGVPVLKPVIDAPPAGSPAALAGFQRGDTVLRIDGHQIEDWQGLSWRLLKHGLDQPRLEIETSDPADRRSLRILDLAGIDLAGEGEDPLGGLGFRPFQPLLVPVVGEVIDGGPAARAGLRPGDRLRAIGAVEIETWQRAVEEIRTRPGQNLRLILERDGAVVELDIVAEAVRHGGERIGRIGAAAHIDPELFASLQTESRYGPLESAGRALAKTWDLSTFSLQMLGRMLIGEASLKNLSGPVSIADYAGRSAEAGLTAFVAFLALVSVSLGVLNLLPIPLLDGGHLLYYLAEFLTGRPVSEAIQAVGQRIGAALLATLMFFALYNDFLRLFSG